MQNDDRKKKIKSIKDRIDYRIKKHGSVGRAIGEAIKFMGKLTKKEIKIEIVPAFIVNPDHVRVPPNQKQIEDSRIWWPAMKKLRKTYEEIKKRDPGFSCKYFDNPKADE